MTLGALRATKVYPRVGGGNPALNPPLLEWHGLSPRGRGKLDMEDNASASIRSIPAWAGETWRWASAIVIPMVYPRVGGGNVALGTALSIIFGLSPRGRGKPPR